METLIYWDKKLFLFLNSLHSSFFDVLMWWISYPFTWIPLYLLIIYLFYKKFERKTFFLLIIALIITVGLSDFTSVHLFKETIKRLRPCHNEELKNLVHLVKNHCGGKYGFVSSHASNSFAIAFFSAYFFKNRFYWILIFLWASLVGYSRIYLGVHFPLDVLGGALWGMFVAYVVAKIINKKTVPKDGF